MSHVVLLGDSIFDNAAYVPDRPPVIEQVRRGLALGWKATLVAVDGHIYPARRQLIFSSAWWLGLLWVG